MSLFILKSTAKVNQHYANFTKNPVNTESYTVNGIFYGLNTDSTYVLNGSGFNASPQSCFEISTSPKFYIFGRNFSIMETLKPLFRFVGKNYPWIFLLLWFAIQLPFLNSDPDSFADIHTRGAWTDEGLYSGTARNFINTGTIDPYENSLFTRGPLFTLTQIPLFFIFGQSLLVARLLVLLSAMLMFWLFMKQEHTRLAGLFLLAAGFTQFHVFHFSHYAMAEMLSTNIILISLLFILRAFNPDSTTGSWKRSLIAAAALLFVAYGMKIQFLYIAFLLPGFALLMLIPHLASPTEERRLLWKKFGHSVLWTAIYAVGYVLLWYLPNMEFYHYVMSREVDSRYHTTISNFFGQSRFNFTELLFVPYLKTLIIAGAVSLAGGLLLLLIRPGAWRPAERLLFLVALLWFFLELHKIPMTYMPHRYLVSAYSSIGLMTALFVTVFIRQGRLPAVIAIVAVCFLAVWQLNHTREAYERRTYDLRALNSYLKQFDWEGETITGAWGPSAAWGTKACVFPVWYGFVNDERAMDARMLIAESDQEDSDRSLIMQGIDISKHTDSVRRFPIWRYEVDLHWLSQKHED